MVQRDQERKSGYSPSPSHHGLGFVSEQNQKWTNNLNNVGLALFSEGLERTTVNLKPGLGKLIFKSSSLPLSNLMLGITHSLPGLQLSVRLKICSDTFIFIVHL